MKTEISLFNENSVLATDLSEVIAKLMNYKMFKKAITEHDQEIIKMIDEMEQKSKEEEERMIAKLMKDKQMEDADGWRACYLYYRMALRGIRSKL